MIAISDQDKRQNSISLIRIPGMLSFLSYNRFEGEVRGLNDLQAEYEETYGPGDYIPPVNIIYWSFRIMVGAGSLLVLVALYSLYLVLRKKMEEIPRIFRFLPLALFLPYIANSTGWMLTEMGRQPWIVFGLQLTEDAISPNLPTSTILFTLITFSLLYGVLMVVDIYLLAKFAIRFEEGQDDPAPTAA